MNSRDEDECDGSVLDECELYSVVGSAKKEREKPKSACKVVLDGCGRAPHSTW
jgi:hypothetical protein